MHPAISSCKNAPAELRSLPQWVCWRYESRHGKRTKPPISPHSNGKLLSAKTNDPATWSDFDTALATAERLKLNGVGLALAESDGLTGLDLDHVLNRETGELDPLAVEVLERFAGTYIEVSPSGDGLRIWCYGKPARSGKCEGPVKWLEIYAHPSSRYLTVTGHRHGAATAVTEQQAALDWLHSRFMVKASTEGKRGASPSVGASLDLDDAALLSKARAARNGAAFDALWAGELSAHGGDASSADLALCNLLAFWTNGDPARMDRLFRQSGLMRAKWDAIHDPASGRTYGQMTVDKAVAGCREGFSGKARTGRAELAELADSKILESPIGESAFSDISESSAIFDTDNPRLLRNKRGGIQKNISNAILVAENLIPGLIGYNEFRQRIEARIPTPWRKVPGAWTDWDTGELADLSARRGFPDFSSEKLNAAIMVTAHRNPFNPAQDRLRALSEQWDGVNRLDGWLTEYLHAETTLDNADYLKEIGAAWMKGTAARVLIPGCKRDDVLVLRGLQGWFKSTAAKVIADAIAPDAFTDSLGNIESRDAKAGIRGIIVAELGELAAFSKSSVEAIKAFVATRSDHFREAYGRLERDFPRTVSFIGTTNDERFLKDPTGNRRWWPVTITQSIDIERFRAALPQLLGEAARRVLDGEAWHVSDRAALQQAEIIRADHFEHDVWTDAVLRAADALASAEGHATVAGILEKMRIPAHLQTTGAQMRVGGILRIAAWNSKRRRVNGRLLVAWSPDGSVHPLDRVNSKGEQVLACETADVHPVHPVHPSWGEVKKTEGEHDDSSDERQGNTDAKYSPHTESGCTGVNRVNTPSNSGDSAVHPCCSPYPKGEQSGLNIPINTGFQRLSNDAKRLWSDVLRHYQDTETVARLAQKSGWDATRTRLALEDLKRHGLAEIKKDSAKPIHPAS